MGSAVSCTSKSKVTESAFEKHSKPKNMEDNTEINSHPPQPPPLNNTDSHPPQAPGAIVSLENESEKSKTEQDSRGIENEKKIDDDDKDAGTEKNQGNAKTQSEEKVAELELMTDEEIAEFKQKTFDHLRSTANEVVALETRQAEGGEYVVKIRNSTIRFLQSYFALKRTVLEEISKFREEIAKIMIETKFFNLSCEIIMKTYKNGWQLEDGKQNDKKYIPLSNSMVTLLNFSDGSDELAVAMANEPGFVELIKQILDDTQQRHLGKVEPPLKQNEERLMKHSLSLIHNMSMRESNIARLRSLDMISSLQPFLSSSNDMFALNALASLAGIINEEECEIINGHKNTVMILLDCLRKGLKDKMRRCKGWSAKECGYTVRMLARNDANMKTLVDLGALELLVELGRTGDNAEQYESVAALWALCFDEDNQSLITGKAELGVVDLLVDLKHSENDSIKKSCNGALWTLRDALKKTVCEKYKKIGEELASNDVKKPRRKKKAVDENAVSSKGQVMISYQWADQQVLKNVRDNIKARGYKVWMDIDQMGGSTLQAMAEGVEGADVFLMCMSSKYKHSPACRAEAEYAFQLRKKIIPLKMERGYTPDGWLGFIVGAKLFFEFSPKYPFEDKMKALLKELNQVFGETADTPDSGEIIKPQTAAVTQAAGAHVVEHPDTASSLSGTVARITVSKATIDNVRKWSNTDLKNWIERNGLQTCGINGLTGGEIALLASMRVECPEFFYKCLQDMLKVKDLLTMSKIVWALHDLS
ncbi:uncharacterized protein LOC123539905 isoform X2 [Mercenaria mercenaria]|uniref:uncharacterized protein LOC123539905 isoform X2 n=1 Tax=Mercenaria mercenaria TaxID=6596 RepID=UPI00234ED9A7|nr:uncharacterized protein LOC123539905 isoform X2 [Mercenaria mercenaria]